MIQQRGLAAVTSDAESHPLAGFGLQSIHVCGRDGDGIGSQDCWGGPSVSRKEGRRGANRLVAFTHLAHFRGIPIFEVLGALRYTAVGRIVIPSGFWLWGFWSRRKFGSQKYVIYGDWKVDTEISIVEADLTVELVGF